MIFSLVLWLLTLIVFFILIKKHRIILKDNFVIQNKKFQEYTKQLQTKYEILEKQKSQDLNFKINNLEKKLFETKKECSIIEQHYQQLLEIGKKQINDRLEEYEAMESKRLEMERYKEDAEKRKQLNIALEGLLSDFNNQKELLNLEIEHLEEILKDYKNKREIINKAILHEREIREQKDFFRININNSDKKDIEILNTIEKNLHNREALYKLIYDVFYKKPLYDLLARVLKGREFCGIYRITNLETNESYIGKSTNIKTRWVNHVKTAIGLEGMARTKIHSAMKEYGIDNFSFEVLEECSKENYSEREKYWINFYETNIYGYNIQK